MGKKHSSTQQEENDLWQMVADSVEPLAGRQQVAASPPPAALKRAKPSADLSRPKIDLPLKPSISSEDAPPVADWRTTKRLKKGKMSIEARVDLHGMTQQQAHGALAAFIAESHDMGRRCVLVITGKGRGGASLGVLRSMVPRWLNQSPNREKIISLTPAAPHDGGDGALYVLVKKKR